MVHFPLLHDSKRFHSQSVCCALLASLPLCLSESASGLSHVVKVGLSGISPPSFFFQRLAGMAGR